MTSVLLSLRSNLRWTIHGDEMGYYTQYNLTQIYSAVSDQELSALISGDELASEALESDGDSKEFVKWYEHENSLCKWSTEYPQTIFKLHAEGEDSDGIWDKYFLGGRLVRAVTFSGLSVVDPRDLLKDGAGPD